MDSNSGTTATGMDNGSNGSTNDIKDMKKFERWRKSLQYITGLGMSDGERKEFRNQVDMEASGWQCQQCESWRDTLMKNSKLDACY
jgi:inner membrane protease ATP23